MATNNAVNNGLSGATGTGSFVGSNSPTLTTPNLGAATATSLTFSPTTNGTVGTTTNNNASAGYVGEFISSTIPTGSPVSFTSSIAANLTSISLTAGDWYVWGNVSFAGTTVTAGQASIGTTSGTLEPIEYRQYIAPVAISTVLGVNAVPRRISIASTTTIYIVGNTTGTGSLTGIGGIYARRVR